MQTLQALELFFSGYIFTYNKPVVELTMVCHEFNTTIWNFMKARKKLKMLAHDVRSKFFVFHAKIAYHTVRQVVFFSLERSI